MRRVAVPFSAVILLGLALSALALGTPEAAEPIDEQAAPIEPATAPAPAPAPILIGAAPTPEPARDDRAADEDLEEPIEEVGDEALPPDPAPIGTCRLRIDLVSAEDGASFPSRVDLWRLDEPGNDHWKRGDRKIGSEHTEEGCATFDALPEGRYRLHVHALAKGAPDPDAFEVAGAETAVTQEVRPPARFPLLLRVYDEQGDFVRFARKQCVGGGSSSRGPARPPWVTRRTLKKPRLRGSRGSWTGCGCGRGGRGPGVPVESVDGWFEVVRAEVPQRYRSSSSSWTLAIQGGSDVDVHKSSDQAEERRFVAATIRMEALRDAIRLPDGRRAVDVGATISADCKAVRVADHGPQPDWREIPIKVRVRCEGYQDLDFDHTLRGPLRDHVLAAKP